MVELFEDERVVGRGSVEGDLHAGELAPAGPVGVGVADDEEGGDDDLEVVEAPSRSLGTSGELGCDGVGEVGAGVEGVDVDTVGVFASEAQHPGVDRGDVDGWVWRVDGAG